MASRAILRRKNYLSDSLNKPNFFIRSSSSFEHGSSSIIPDWMRAAIHTSTNTEHSEERDSYLITKDKVSTISTKKKFKHDSYRVPTFDYRIGTPGSLSPLGVRWVKEFVRYSSTATAGKPDPHFGDNKNESTSVKLKKEASPEECDQAVEGLSTVKARAKAKQLQDTQKDETSIIKRIWARLLGIGPALKAVASMSRLNLLYFSPLLFRGKRGTLKCTNKICCKYLLFSFFLLLI